MRLILKGGPYDGVAIDHNDMNLHTRFRVAAARTFILMPPRDRWDIVRQTGVKDVGGELIAYELLGTPIRAAQYDQNGDGLAAALRDQIDGRTTASG